MARSPRFLASSLPEWTEFALSDVEDPAYFTYAPQRCHWVLLGLKCHALRSGLAESRVDSLLDAVEQRALARLARGACEAGEVVRWVWKEAVAALRATSTR